MKGIVAGSLSFVLAGCVSFAPPPLSSDVADAYVVPTGVCRITISTGIGGDFDEYYPPDERLLVIGTTECEQGTCRVVDLKHRWMWTRERVGMRITADGAVTGMPVNIGKGNKMIGKLRVAPAECRFVAPNE